jgi:hypothetical protein
VNPVLLRVLRVQVRIFRLAKITALQKLALFLLICVLFSCKKTADGTADQLPKGIATSHWIDQFTWVQYGTMPLVISVPHGGLIAPDSIPDRTCPNITNATDLNTIEMVKAIDSVCFADYKLRPFIVYTTLKRTKLDQNREVAEATCGSSSKEKLWNNFHAAIDTAINRVKTKYPQCLYIDLHAHGHALQQLELGYLLSRTQLQNSANVSPTTSSLLSLFDNNAVTLSQLLTGASAFGTLMTNEGYPSVPSAAYPFPAPADPYFDGGYNTARYTSVSKTFGWQVESNYNGVRENASQRARFAKAFLKSIITFCSTHTKLRPEAFGY